MCGNVLDDCILCSLYEMMCMCMCVCVVCCEGESLQLGDFGSPLSICSNIPTLIETRAPSRCSLNKELLFLPCVYLHVCIQNYLLSLSVPAHLVI